MEYIKVGVVLRAHGIAGALKINVEEKYIDDLFEAEAVFLEIKGAKVPYFVEDMREGNMLLMYLEEVKDRTVAESLHKCPIYMRRSDISLTDEQIEAPYGMRFGHLFRFTLLDATRGEIGLIEEVLEYPQQEMAEINYQGRLILIPLNPDWIQKIDETERTVLMDLPEGLLDL